MDGRTLGESTEKLGILSDSLLCDNLEYLDCWFCLLSCGQVVSPLAAEIFSSVKVSKFDGRMNLLFWIQ
jgi:hypothetical protein